MEQDMYELTSRIVEGNGIAKTQVIWKFKDIAEILHEKTLKEVATTVLKPHGDCDCDEFRHPKAVRLKLSNSRVLAGKLVLELVHVPSLPLQSKVFYESSYQFKHCDDEITEHYGSGWQHLRYITATNRDMRLTITIYLMVIKNLLFEPARQFERSKTTPMVGLCDDMEKLLEESTDSDLSLLSEEGTLFKVHRLILAMRSEVFKAMFKHDQRTEIGTLYEEKVLKEVVTYIYTSKTPGIGEMARELMGAADFYQLDGLKTACAKTLHKQLTPDNAVEILELADKYSCEELLKLSLQYIQNGHADLVIKTEGWKKSSNRVKRILELVIEPVEFSG